MVVGVVGVVEGLGGKARVQLVVVQGGLHIGYHLQWL